MESLPGSNGQQSPPGQPGNSGPRDTVFPFDFPVQQHTGYPPGHLFLPAPGPVPVPGTSGQFSFPPGISGTSALFPEQSGSGADSRRGPGRPRKMEPAVKLP